MIGQTLSHYRIIKEIGKGGMGVVYLADDLVLHRQVAIKTLNESGLGKQHHRARFIREARAVSSLSHPNIATVFDFGETPENHPYIVMEYVKGQTLAELIAKGNLKLERSVQIAIEIAKALAEAHAQGILHRDIKPSNVIIGERGRVKVLDFGLVKQIEPVPLEPFDEVHVLRGIGSSDGFLPDTGTREGIIVGTPSYLSPEQADGGEVDHRSDIFSLGAVLYECISGRPAFIGTSEIDICDKVINDDPQPPSELNPDVAPPLEQLTLKALEKDPSKRYQTCEELVAILSTVQVRTNGSGLAKTTGYIKPQTIPSESRSLVKSLKRPHVSLRALLLLIALGMGIWGINRLLRLKPHQPPADAQELFDEGNRKLFCGMPFEASRLFQSAISKDVSFVLAHARLAEALNEIDQTENAAKEISTIDQLLASGLRLSEPDALYVQAIRYTVERSRKQAIRSYEAILNLNNNDTVALINLGRAYEHDNQITMAIAQYERATLNNPYSAEAFLRLGVTYGKLCGSKKKAGAALEKADGLFHFRFNLDGQTEVAYQRGSICREYSELSESRNYLQMAIGHARATNNRFHEVKSMFELSWLQYKMGDWEPSKLLARDALEIGQHSNLEIVSAEGLIKIGTAQLKDAEIAAAEESFGLSLTQSTNHSHKRAEAFALMYLAEIYLYHYHKPREALDFLHKSSAFLEAGGYDDKGPRVFYIRAWARSLVNDSEGARKDLKTASIMAARFDDKRTVAVASQLLGQLGIDQENYLEALAQFETADRVYKELGSSNGPGDLLISQCETLWRLGRVSAAEARLVDLQEWLKAFQSNQNVVREFAAKSALSRAGILYIQGDWRKAEREVRLSLRLFGSEINRSSVIGKCMLGAILIRRGLIPDSLIMADEAITLAKQLNNPYLLSASLLLNAEALLESGESTQALTIALQIQERANRDGAFELEWRAWLLSSRAYLNLGNITVSNQHIARAAGVLAVTRSRFESEAYNYYLSRADIKIWYAMVKSGMSKQPEYPIEY